MVPELPPKYLDLKVLPPMVLNKVSPPKDLKLLVTAVLPMSLQILDLFKEISTLVPKEITTLVPREISTLAPKVISILAPRVISTLAPKVISILIPVIHTVLLDSHPLDSPDQAMA
ncbi:PREDICTED: uncharacterized protein LOC108564113 [Nicrophorus vespilloides]|uniref:Uncharacterized protein LOC108564113 n=1 Tax=Nicrophorus vespilloides TaxID=110193 RepID=A0ABM1MVD1_NICVS|nr:PREDICTED: uncharacterized protein LOC108564113 [Nicrophorus vespilloides]